MLISAVLISVISVMLLFWRRWKTVMTSLPAAFSSPLMTTVADILIAQVHLVFVLEFAGVVARCSDRNEPPLLVANESWEKLLG